MHVAIIGSGLAGLTAGAALAQAGQQVTILEQAGHVGGVTAPYEAHGFRWDLGQLLVEGLGPDEPLGRILAALGVADQVPVRVEDRGYVFPDFELRKPAEYEGPRWRIDRLRAMFPDDAAGLDRYWADYLRFTGVMTLARRLERASGPAALALKARLFWKLLPLLPRKDWSAQRLMDHYFSSEKLKVVFTSILADFFTAPGEFIGLGVFALNPEASFDRRLPRTLRKDTEQLYHYSILGGMGSLVDALATRIVALGGRIETGHAVTRIVVEGGRARGTVDAAGHRLDADAVVASGGARETFLKLVGAEHLPAAFAANVARIPLMDSIFMVHLGVDFDPSPHLHGVCTYYYGSYDIARAIADGRGGVFHEGRDGFVVHVPSLHSPGMAPPGHHAMTIYTICPDILRDGDWEERKEEFAEKLIACAEERIPGLRQHVRVAEILTPRDWRARAHLDHHAFGGIAPVLGAWRVPHRSPVDGLWFIGAQSESGGGINNVMPGAYRTALKILDA